LYNPSVSSRVDHWSKAFLGLASGGTWDRAEIRAFQTAQLRSLVRHAYERVPYYRALFDGVGLKPERIQELSDLAAIPFTAKADVQHRSMTEIVAKGYDGAKLAVHRTSGSSGEPMSIRRTWFEDRLLQAYRLRVLAATAGFRITDRRAAVLTQKLMMQPAYMKLGLFRYEEVHSLLPPQEILAKLRAIRPDVLRGYPGTLSWLVDYLTGEDRALIRPRLITTDSEMMTADMRSRITQGFRAPVVDFYDSHEFNLIASECPSTGLYHVSDTSVIVEVVRDGQCVGPNQEGELVGTALHSWAVPFIRYRLGDLVTRGPDRCPCGAPNSVIARVQGRVCDRFNLADGRAVHPYILVHVLMAEAPWLRQYQIVQEDPGLIRVRVAPLRNTTPDSDAVNRVGQAISTKLGGTVRVIVDVVDHIAMEPSGKYRPYYSRVPQPPPTRTADRRGSAVDVSGRA
jgi:phenylacetate-CoA ligase